MNHHRIQLAWLSIAYVYLFPLCAASVAILVPLWFAAQRREVFVTAMAILGGCTWLFLAIVLVVSRRWLHCLAAVVGAGSVLFVWGAHVLLAHEHLRLYTGIPSVLEFVGASTWWGTFFTLLFSSVYAFQRLQPQKPSVTAPPSHPGREVASSIVLANVLLAATVAVVSAFLRGDWFALWALASLHLPLQTIKDAARPGMGSGGYYMGSILLYLVLGTGFQAVLARLVCRIGHAMGLLGLPQSDAHHPEP